MFLIDVFFGLCIWLLWVVEVLLFQGYWKKEEYGKCFMFFMKEYFEKVFMRVLWDLLVFIEFENVVEEKRDFVEEVGGEGVKN